MREVRDAARLRREQEVAQRIDDDAVHLLRHRGVEAAQACLDMRDRNPEGGRGKRPRGAGIDVADDHDQIGPEPSEHLLEVGQHPPDLCRLPAGGAGKHDVGRRKLQLREQLLRHRGVVVLPGMDEQRREHVGTRPLRGEHRGHLYEVRPGPDDVDDPNHGGVDTTSGPKRSNRASLARRLRRGYS